MKPCRDDTGVFQMVITDMRMETEAAGFDVIHAVKQAPYNPANAMLTAHLLRQIEILE